MVSFNNCDEPISARKGALNAHAQAVVNKPAQSKMAQAIFVALGVSALGAMAFSLAYSSNAHAAPNVSIIKTLEHANTTPASMCFTFSGRETVLDDKDNLSTFIKLYDSEGKLAPTTPALVQGNLCLGELAHGQNYQMTLQKGLAFTSGIKLSENLKHSFTISDAVAQLKLPYNIILPKNGANSSFAVQSVNQPSFKLSIYRIPQSVLDKYTFEELANNSVSLWTINRLINDTAHPIYERIFNLSNGSSLDVLNKNTDDLASASVNDANAVGGVDGLTADALSKQLKEAQSAKLKAEAKNKATNTNINLKDFVRDSDNGVYLVIASDPRIDYSEGFNYETIYNNNLPISAKLLVLTDLGLSTYKSEDSILVNVRSITSAKSLENIKVSLLAANGEVLTTATTDKNGSATFTKEFVTGKRGMAPTIIVAEGKNDIFDQDLRSAPLYLEDNQGKRSNHAYETFAYTDRGIYRPGETIHYTALVRNQQLEGVDLPLTLSLATPFGSEPNKITLAKSYNGGYEYDFHIPEGTPNGRYVAKLYLGKKLLSETPVTIGAYVPTQINSSFLSNDALVAVNSLFKVRTKTSFNYGGAASNLSGYFYMTLSPDRHPVPATANAANNPFLQDFHFGPDERKTSELTKSETFTDIKTDVEGVLQQDVEIAASDYPQEVKFVAHVIDPNGQTDRISKSFKVAYQRPLLGVRMLEKGKDGNGDAASFALCSYLQDGSTYPQDVKYYIYKEFVDYNYVYENGAWRYVSFTSRNLVANGQVRVDNQGLDSAAISSELQDGSYVLELESDKSKTSLAFVKGFASSNDATTPDRISLYADKQSYQVGDKVKFTFDSPFDGYANLAIGNKGINEFKTFKVEEGSNTIELEVTSDLYPQGHALLSIFSPLDEDSMGAVRAVGFCDINLNMDAHKLEVTTDAPEEIKPNTKLSFNISAKQSAANTAPAQEQDKKADAKANAPASAGIAPEGGYAKVTLVDNGILALTGFKAPNPNDTLMADRAYELSLYDAYGYLMRDPKQQGQGYGGGEEEMLMDKASSASANNIDSVSFKTVALASKIVPLDKDGKAQVEFDVPQFSGSLKLMTVAWDKERTGSSDSNILIRDNAVATLGLPRYLNVGDSVQARLNLHNLKASNNDFKIDITCSGSLQCSVQDVMSLKPGIRGDKYFTIKSNSDGLGEIKLTVLNPDFKLKDQYQLLTTYPQLPMLKNIIKPLDKGGEVGIKISKKFADIDEILVSLSPLPNVNVEALVKQMEQSSQSDFTSLVAELESKLLYGSYLVANDKTKEALANAQTQEQAQESLRPYATQEQLNSKIQELVFRILSRQWSDGNFAAPNPYDNIYASAVLLKAQEAGFNVTPAVIDKALSNLRSQSASDNENSSFALAVLSEHESINQAHLRFLLDENRLQKPLSLAKLAIALHHIGDKGRVDTALKSALQGIQTWQALQDDLATKDLTNQQALQILQRIDQLAVTGKGSLRETAYTLIDAAIIAGRLDIVDEVLSSVHDLKVPTDYMAPSTMAAMLKASFSYENSSANGAEAAQGMHKIRTAMLSKEQIAALRVKKAKSEGKQVAADNSNAVIGGASDDFVYVKDGKLFVKNDSQSPLYATVSILGQYQHDKIISNKGFATKVNFFNRNGKIDLSKYEFRTNEEVMMEIFVERKVKANSDMIVKSKIPAGFEFVRRIQGNDDPSFGKLLKNNNRITYPDSFENGDDMMVATYNRYNVDRNFSLFVVLRAAHPGVFKAGESLVQLKADPGFYGTYLGDNDLKILDPAATNAKSSKAKKTKMAN